MSQSHRRHVMTSNDDRPECDTQEVADGLVSFSSLPRGRVLVSPHDALLCKST